MAKTKTASTPLPTVDTSPLPDTYEAALKELETLVRRVESGDMPLEELLTSYQRGAQLLSFCREKLQAVESQIKVLEGTVLRPWQQG